MNQQTPFSSGRALILSLVAAVCLLAPHRSIAKEETFPTYNCAITPPEGWTQTTKFPPQPGVFAIFSRPDQRAIIMLQADERFQFARLDDKSVAEFEKGMQSTGVGPPTSHRFTQIAGMKAYERLGSVTIKGRLVSMLMLAIPVAGRSYSITVMRFDGATSDDPEIRQSLQTFRFLKSPAPAPSGPSSAAYRAGYFMGSALTIGALVIGGIFLIIRLAKPRPAPRGAAGPLPPRPLPRRPHMPPPIPPMDEE